MKHYTRGAEYTLRRKDTGETWVGSYNFSPIHDNHHTIGAIISAQDITERKQAESILRASEIRYRSAFQTSLDGMMINRFPGGKFIEANQTFFDITGYTREEVIGRTTPELGLWTNPRDQEHLVGLLQKNGSCRDFQAQFRKKTGDTFWGIMSSSTLNLDVDLSVFSVLRDISEMKQAEEEIRNLSFFDSLTGLANRRQLMELSHNSKAFGTFGVHKRAMLFVDLDDFKILNDTHGHHTGDLLLREVAKRLSTCVRKIDMVARLGGDEFVLILDDMGETVEGAAGMAKAAAEKILTEVGQPYLLNGRQCNSTCSIGVSIIADNHQSISDVVQQAEIAMFKAKEAGRNTMFFFSPELQTALKFRATMEEAIRQGIKQDQFMLYYQPQVEHGQVIGAEALVRWKHPTRGILPPGEFISLAEETRLILPLGDLVLESACRQIAAWGDRKQISGMKLAVNVSAIQLREQDFVQTVLSVLDRTGANPENLKLEITESMLLDNVEDVISKMTSLKSHGLSFSVDDFGTGYSSLAYLKRLPLDQLKIDGAFVRDILVDEGSSAIAKAIISLGNAMGLSVIAEGVETEEQQNQLANLGCHCYQGYLFSRPLPLEEFELLLPSDNESASANFS